MNMKSRADLLMEKQEIYNEFFAFCKNHMDLSWISSTHEINKDDAHSHCVEMVFSEVGNNIIIADGVKTDVEKAVQYVSLKMMILKEKLISKKDSSNHPNLIADTNLREIPQMFFF